MFMDWTIQYYKHDNSFQNDLKIQDNPKEKSQQHPTQEVDCLNL